MKLLRPLSRSLNAKLLMFLMLVALFTSLTTAIIFSAYELNSVSKTERIRLNSIANILAPNLTAAIVFEDDQSIQGLIKPLLNQSNVVSATVLDVDGHIISQALSDKENNAIILTDIMVITEPLMIEGTRSGTLEIKADYSLVEQSLLLFSLFILGNLALILALSFVLALFLRKSLIYPLIHLTSVADQVSKTNKYNVRADVLSKDEVGNLANCFNQMLETIQERDHILEIQVVQRTKALKQANIKLSEQAYSDALTGLPNRRYILDNLEKIIGSNYSGSNKKLHAFFDTNFAVLGIDLDGFKEINDTLGHDYGDRLLVAVSNRIDSILPKNASLGRLGGDEFIVLIENIESKEIIEDVIVDIQSAITDGFIVNGKKVYITISIGTSIYPNDGLSVDTIVKHADLAMYKSKESGRNCHHFFHPDMLDNLVNRREIIVDLRTAIINDEFELYYQPIIDLTTNQVSKAEALIRWNHPTRGMVPPFEFIYIAEETGFIKELGEWVARTAAKDLSDLHRLGATQFKISINVSPLQFMGDGKWMLDWFDYMAELGLDSDAIIVEITENLLMENEDSIRDKLFELKHSGRGIAIDDFGVGYSSLSYLQKMDVDILKIDKSFVDHIGTEKNSFDLCSAIIMMASHLDIEVVAEGIESDLQRLILTELGCQYGQGYIFDKPLPLTTFKDKYLDQLVTIGSSTIHSDNKAISIQPSKK